MHFHELKKSVAETPHARGYLIDAVLTQGKPSADGSRSRQNLRPRLANVEISALTISAL